MFCFQFSRSSNFSKKVSCKGDGAVLSNFFPISVSLTNTCLRSFVPFSRKTSPLRSKRFNISVTVACLRLTCLATSLTVMASWPCICFRIMSCGVVIPCCRASWRECRSIAWIIRLKLIRTLSETEACVLTGEGKSLFTFSPIYWTLCIK